MPRTQVVPLDFSNLAHLDEGRINKLLALHLQRAAQDCQNRPGDKTARKVTLEFQVKPILDISTGEAPTASIEMECKTKTPVHRSKPYEMRVDSRGFYFNRDFPDALDQIPLIGEEDD